MTDNPDVEQALEQAVAALYFGDSSDYGTALWQVVDALDPEAAELLMEDAEEAYNRYADPKRSV